MFQIAAAAPGPWDFGPTLAGKLAMWEGGPEMAIRGVQATLAAVTNAPPWHRLCTMDLMSLLGNSPRQALLVNEQLVSRVLCQGLGPFHFVSLASPGPLAFTLSRRG